ncbi:unnamed protein product [Urochloa humidicola]
MARLRLPTCVVLLLLAAAGLALLASSSSAAPAPPPPEGKVRVTVRYADEEEAQWLDSWAETHQPLGSGGGHFKLTPASPEVSAWLDRLSDRYRRHYVVLKHGDDP